MPNKIFSYWAFCFYCFMILLPFVFKTYVLGLVSPFLYIPKAMQLCDKSTAIIS